MSDAIRIDRARVAPDGLLHVEGWAVAPAVTAVQIFFGHRFLGFAELGRPRADVGVAFADHPRAAWSGFLLVMDMAGEDLTARTVHARAVLAAGPPLRASVEADIAALAHPAAPPPAEIVAACDHCAVLPSGELAVSGWAVSGTGIERVMLALDGGAAVAAAIGLPRPEIGNRFPRLPGARECGFAFSGKLPGGAHEPRRLVATITARDGREHILDQALGDPPAAPDVARGVGRDEANRIKFFIDSPELLGGAARRPMRANLAVRGWAIGRDRIAAVEVAFDAQLLGGAYLGLNRSDIFRTFPDWPESRRSGFAFDVPPALLSRGRHRLDLTIRDGAGRQVETGFDLDVDADAGPIPTTVLRRFVRHGELAMNRAIIGGHGAGPRFAVLVQLGNAGPRELRRAAQTLQTLREQAYAELQPVLMLAPGLTECGVRTLLESFADLGLLARQTGEGALTDPGCSHVMVLRAGDLLGADALMEFAVAACRRPTPDLIYADAIRLDRAAGAKAADFKPRWSPELLLSTNYLGRAWCATSRLVQDSGADAAGLYARGGYDLVLRLAERARHVESVSQVLCSDGAGGDSPALERQAVARAARRRGIEGAVEDGRAPGLFRLRRRVAAPPLVSIVMPTNASRGLFRTAIGSVRRTTGHMAVELVAVDNIDRADAPARAWLRAHADRVVPMPGPFNWSRFNNAGATRAQGAVLLFLNDDIEARQPGWLEAMLEQALRPEIGVVGARLLYPDGKLQHAGVHLSATAGQHSYRFLAGDAPGPFGYAMSLREVTAVTGACLMVRREVFDALGGFDEAHAVINNDLDFCLRARARGRQVVCTPYAELTHHEMGSREHLPERFDGARFDSAWGIVMARGDPFVSANLRRGSDALEPDPEPVRTVAVGGALLEAVAVRRILAMKLDHIGDFVTALPALARLKARFPQAALHVLCSPDCAALARANPAVDGVIPFAFYHARSARGPRRPRAEEMEALAERLAALRFDIAIDLRKHPETRFLLRHTGARVLAGFDRDARFGWLDVPMEWDSDAPAMRKRRHVSDDLLMLVDAVAIACAVDDAPSGAGVRHVPAAAASAVPRRGARDRPRICVHPAAGNAIKQWPPEYFSALLDVLAEDEDAEFVLVGTKAEAPLAERVRRGTRCAGRVTSLVGQLTLEALPAVLRECDLFVGNDSGPKHLAAALDVPTVGIHSGIVDPVEWGPAGRHAVAVYRQMVCSPCYLTKASACPRGLACLHGLLPGDVAATCRRMLSGARSRYDAAEACGEGAAGAALSGDLRRSASHAEARSMRTL